MTEKSPKTSLIWFLSNLIAVCTERMRYATSNVKKSLIRFQSPLTKNHCKHGSKLQGPREFQLTGKHYGCSRFEMLCLDLITCIKGTLCCLFSLFDFL